MQKNNLPAIGRWKAQQTGRVRQFLGLKQKRMEEEKKRISRSQDVIRKRIILMYQDAKALRNEGIVCNRDFFFCARMSSR